MICLISLVPTYYYLTSPPILQSSNIIYHRNHLSLTQCTNTSSLFGIPRALPLHLSWNVALDEDEMATLLD